MPQYFPYPGVTGATVFPVPWRHWCHSISRTLASLVRQYFLYPGVTGATVFPVPWRHWCHSISLALASVTGLTPFPLPKHHITSIPLTLVLLVPQYFPYPGITGATVFPVPWHHWCHSFSLILASLVPTTVFPLA